MLLLLLRRITAVALCFSVLTVSAQSVSEPAYANMQRSVGGIIQSATQSMGYSPNDPRTYGTLRGVGQATAGAAAAAGTGILVAGSAPAWATILAIAAVSGSVSYGVGITLDATVKWAFGSGATPVTMTIPATSGSGPISPLGNPLGCASPVQTQIYNWCVKGGERDPMCMSSPPYTCQTIAMCPGQANPTLAACGPGGSFSGAAQTQQALQTIGYTFAPATGTETQSNKTLVDAIASLTAAQKQQAVSYDAMALMINQMWQKASAQPGYAGVPYSVTSPVTAAQVQAYAQANPSAYPKVEALTSPVTSGATGFSPSTTTVTGTPVSPSISETPPTATNPSTQTQTNLGPDPNIGAPTLEATPTAQMIMAPLIALFPDLKAYNVPGHTGACPKPSFDVFGTSILMDQHCTIFEQQRAALYAAGLLAFTLIALFIVLSA